MTPPPYPAADASRPWWATRKFVLALVLISATPLLYPAVPPLVDLFGHMGRYRVELDLASSPSLQQFYEFHWAVIGNLGVDLLIVPLSKLLGLELAVKLIVLAIPPMTVAGFLWVAREVHHRLPPTAFFALPFAYSYPFLFGFVNFTLAMALALLAFGFWLRLARLGRRAPARVPVRADFDHRLFHPRLRLGHAWPVLLFGRGGAVARSRPGLVQGRPACRAAHASVMLLPLGFMLFWRSGTSAQLTSGWFDWERKWEWIYSALRDRYERFDIATLAIIGCVFLLASVSSPPGIVAQPRLLGIRPDHCLRPVAVDDLRIGLRGHADRALHDGHHGPRHSLQGRDRDLHFANALAIAGLGLFAPAPRRYRAQPGHRRRCPGGKARGARSCAGWRADGDADRPAMPVALGLAARHASWAPWRLFVARPSPTTNGPMEGANLLRRQIPRRRPVHG